jgi:hypothetical protein
MSGLTRRVYRGSRRSHREPSRDGSSRTPRTDARAYAPKMAGSHLSRAGSAYAQRNQSLLRSQLVPEALVPLRRIRDPNGVTCKLSQIVHPGAKTTTLVQIVIVRSFPRGRERLTEPPEGRCAHEAVALMGPVAPVLPSHQYLAREIAELERHLVTAESLRTLDCPATPSQSYEATGR